MMFTQVITDPGQVFWTITADAVKVDNNTGTYTRPVSWDQVNPQRCYPAYKPQQTDNLYVTFDVAWTFTIDSHDWISFATFANDNYGTKVLAFNYTLNTGFHWGHTLNQADNTNIWTKPVNQLTIKPSFHLDLKVYIGGLCMAYVDGEIVAVAQCLNIEQIFLTHYGLYTSSSTQYLSVSNYNVREWHIA